MIAPLVIGVLFGVLLQLGGLTRHERITGVFLLRDLAVMQFLVSGLIAGGLVLAAARALGFVTEVPIVPSHLAAQAVGGAIFGAGMAVAGFCPGTIAAAAGTGRLDALVPGVLGLLAGAWLAGVLVPCLPAWLAAGGLGATTIPAWLGVSPWLVLLLLAELAVIGFHGRHTVCR